MVRLDRVLLLNSILSSVYWLGKDLRKRPSAGCLTDGSNLSTSPSEIQQQQHISEHHTPSRSRLSPYPVHMMYQGPLGESTPNAAQDIENSLFGFDWSTPLIASPSIVSPSIVSSPMLSPIVSSYATPRKKSKLSRNALQDTPLSSRVHQQVEAKRKPKAATPKKRYVVYNMPVQPLKVNRNDKPRKNNWKVLVSNTFFLVWSSLMLLILYLPGGRKSLGTLVYHHHYSGSG